LILLEMAAGRPAFMRDTPAATLNAIINDEPERLSALDARLPAAFRWMVERCLAKDVNDRYGVTSGLLGDLRMLRDRFGELIAAYGGRPSPAIVPSSKRGAIAATALVAFAAGMVLSILLAASPRHDTSTLRFAPFTTDSGYQGFPAWSPDGQTIAYA